MGAEMTTLRLAEPFRAVFYAPYYVAIARGEAAAEGIDLVLSTAGSPDVAAAGLIDGSMDVAWSGPMRPLLERSRDPASPLRSFGAAVVRDPFLLVGRGAAPGFRLADLAGLRIAVPSEVPTPVWCLLDDLRRAAVPADGLARRPMPEAAAALRAGEIDAALVFEPFAAELEEQGCTVWYAAATRGPTAYSALYATAARIARTPDLFAALRRALGGALAVVAIVFFLVDGAGVLAALGIGLAVWLILGALTDLGVKAGAGKERAPVVLRRLKGLSRSIYGTALAHLGLGATVLGIVAVTSLESEHIAVMHPGDTMAVAGYSLTFEGLQPHRGPNFTEEQGRFVYLDSDGRQRGEIVSSKRLYTARQMPTTEAGIATRGFSQLYVSLGDPTPDGGVVVRVWWKPLVLLIWLGGVVMMTGGSISLFDRRFRVGAPSRKPIALTRSDVPAE